MLIRNVVLAVTGFSGGAFAATGFFALITMIGLVNRYAQKTRTAVNILWYEECVIWGVTIGSLWFVFEPVIPVGNVGLAIIGLFGGVYAGCLAVALAEIIKSIPIMLMRTKLSSGIGILMLAFALGKGIGSLIYFFWLNYLGGV
jgi:stage V sporulation protein AB